MENGVFALLQELGHRVVVQTVIAGGPDAEETVKGTMALLASTEVPLILWLNEHLGPLQLQGRPIAEAAFLHEARDRILGTVLLSARTKATFGKDTEEMLRQHLTFAEAIAVFDLMPRLRDCLERQSLSRYTQPEPEQQILLDQLRLTLPPQPPPRISAATATPSAQVSL